MLRSHHINWLVLAGLVGCANAPGEITVANHYTGPCTFLVGFDEKVLPTDPLAPDAQITVSAEAGAAVVEFITASEECACGFEGSMTLRFGSCSFYVAGDFGGSVEIVDGADFSCNAQPSPRLLCTETPAASP